MTCEMHVCLDCRSRGSTPVPPLADGRQLLAAIRLALSTAFPGATPNVAGLPCLGLCAKGGRVSLAAQGRWTWLFERIATPTDIEDLTRFVAAWLRSPDGLVPKDERPKALRGRIVARVPPIGHTAPQVHFQRSSDDHPTGDHR